MELGRGYKAKNGRKTVNLDSGTALVIRIPDAQVLRIVSRSLLLAMVLAAMLFLGPIVKGFSSSSNSVVVSGFEDAAASSWSINAEMLSLILRDLGEEGLFKKEGKALIVSPPHGFEGVALLNNEVDVVMDSDLVTHSFFPGESYDFVFTPNFQDANFADRILKVDGIVAFPLSTNPSHGGFRKLPNYRVVYLKRYGSMVVAWRKVGLANKLMDSSPKRKLCQLATDAKRKALKGLEDVLLEPPSAKSKKNFKIKYLPDLLGNSLEDYKRRVFITAGLPKENKGAIQWFEQKYPKKSSKFKIQSLLVAPENPTVPASDISAWLSKHVQEEEYVVMKAEADVMEETMKKKAMQLVDELFLGCNNEWWQTGKRKNGGRAHRECLALYGRLRDQGVAVHQ